MPLSTGITVDDIKTSLRIEGTQDDQQIQGLIDLAENYVKSAVNGSVELPVYRQIPQFNGAVALLVQFYFEARGEVSPTPSAAPLGVQAFIGQLRGFDLGQAPQSQTD